MKSIRKLLWMFWILTARDIVIAQTAPFNFHHLTTNAGLSNGVIRSIARDKYGYTWIGTVNGLNRFNGYDAKVFQHRQADSFSLPENVVAALLCDRNGTLWIDTGKGIYQYNYSNSRFILQPGSRSLIISKMVQGDQDTLYLATTTGLVVFNTRTRECKPLAATVTGTSVKLLGRPVRDFCRGTNGTIYIATDSGLVVYENGTHAARPAFLKPLGKRRVDKVGTDKDQNVWVSYGESGDSLVRADKNFSTFTEYGKYLSPANTVQGNTITAIFRDDKDRLWLTTGRQGLCLYRPESGDFLSCRHDPLQSMSIISNLTTCIYQDGDGFIWVGTEGYGVDYFHPGKMLFHSIQASYDQTPTLPDIWCRAAVEDKQGFLWLGTASGVARYDPVKSSFKVFQNTTTSKVLQYNSIRSLLCLNDDIWIGTANGLNRYNIRTGKMEFLSSKDSVPVSFYWAIIKDHADNVWLGCRDGLYMYSARTGKFRNFANDPLLAPYSKLKVMSLYEDSRHRLWIGFYGIGGLLLYDPGHKTVQYWRQKDGDTTGISNNNIYSITEDKSGIIWVATNDGLNTYNEKTNGFRQFGERDRIPLGTISSLLVDERNRVWMAASKGLYMIDSARRSVKAFDPADGLPSVDFNTQSAYRTGAGKFIYPTLNGFLMFDPLLYSEAADTCCVYVSSFKVPGKKRNDATGFESVGSVRLKSDEGYFMLEMTALNYVNPAQTWYAYKLEPMDKDWTYTRERSINYANVPGGDYVFHYKASTDINNWRGTERVLFIHVDSVFYRTWWFRLMIGAFTAGLFYWLYRVRMLQRERVHALQTKAHGLEKEKTQVMYESLKQQLNPHFLFNSLTSLSSLITINPPDAKRFLDKMSKIYRYILKNRDSEVVLLAEELKLAEIYTQLQQTRFRKGLEVTISADEEYLDRKIAPVTIQNLIENAIKHNIIDEETPLLVSIFTKDGYLVVQNNLQRKTFVETSNRQGLANMCSLYHFLSDMPVIITEDTQFYTVKIPLI